MRNGVLKISGSVLPVFALLLPALVVLSGCASGGGALDVPDLQARLASNARAETDRARDAGRRPAEVLSFLGVKPGMTALDLIAAGGYYTEVLSLAVGPGGTVYAQNPDAVLKFRNGANDKELTARLAGGRLANVVRLDKQFTELGIPLNSVDVAITALNFHDVYNRDAAQATGMASVVFATLKPGGTLGVIDHVGNAGADNAKLHRMQKQDAVAAITAAGFTLAGESDLLAHAEDDHTQFVFAPGLRGRTDRFVLRFTKP